MFTKFRTINKGKNDYCCYLCNKLISIGEKHTYGVTTDSYLITSKKQIAVGRFCARCRSLSANADQHL